MSPSHRLFFCTIILLLCLVHLEGSAQNKCDTLLSFVRNADMDSYCRLITKLVNSDLQNEYSGIRHQPVKLISEDITRQRMIPLLCVAFRDMDSFSPSSDAYQHIIIDSAVVFVMAIMDRALRLEKMVNIYGGYNSQLILSPRNKFIWDRDDKKMRTAIRSILNKQPDCIMICPLLGGGSRHLLSPLIDFMFIKKGIIYYYRTSEKKAYELNEYVRRKFNDLTEWSELWVPDYIDRGHSAKRKAGHTNPSFNLVLRVNSQTS